MITSKYIKTGETKNYSIFISPPHQRDINKKQIKGIMDSMSEHGIISAVSVRKSSKHRGKLEVFAGQHTVEACRRLNAPVVYCEFEGVKDRAMISLDSSAKSWSMQDKLKFGVTDGIKDYIFLDRIYRQEKLPEFADTKEYLALLRKYLNRCRDNIIGDIKMNQAYEEYIIYK